MPIHGKEVPLPLRHAVITCRLLYSSSWAVIEQKTGVDAHTAAKLTHKAIQRAGNEDLNDVLNQANNAIGRGQHPRITNGSELSAQVREAMLKHSYTSPVKAVLDKENIQIPGARKGQKRKPSDIQRSSRVLLERVQHEHIHVNPEGEIVHKIIRKRKADKQWLNKSQEHKRKLFCK